MERVRSPKIPKMYNILIASLKFFKFLAPSLFPLEQFAFKPKGKKGSRDSLQGQIFSSNRKTKQVRVAKTYDM